MFHFISTPLIQVPHNPNWILARCCAEYCRVLTMRGHKKPTQAGSNDAEDELMVAISLPRFPPVPQRTVPLREQPLHPSPVAVRRIQGDTTTWSKYLHFIHTVSKYLYYLYFLFQDCTDGTDESNCTAVSCPDDKFNCPQVRHYASLQPGHVHTVMWSRGTCCATLSVATRALLRNHQITWGHGHVTKLEHCRYN